jgi:sodium transport system permease protein
MRWSNVWTIFRREVRDQARDRRTLFMVFVLPILLYPLLGMGILQVAFSKPDPPREVIVLGAEFLPESPGLLTATKDGFLPEFFENPADAEKLKLKIEAAGSEWERSTVRQYGIREKLIKAVVMIPADVKAQLAKDGSAKIPIDYLSTNDASKLAFFQIQDVIGRWNDKILKGRLAKDNKPASYVEPVRTSGSDVATRAEAGGNVWARLFPFLLVIMALTGAFYPAVDLCAGEKERGTMETLLICPASRTEIVIGKFLTIVLASMLTALLNLVSMGLTGFQLAKTASSIAGSTSAGILAPPTLTAGFWMVVILVPLAIFLGAICLSVAVMAKSMKEGQYYMTPLYMIALPLILLTFLPGIELTPFYSLVPITGVALLLKSLLMGEYAVARQYFLWVLVPMVIYGGVALRWAVEQFNRESVLFRESERFDVSSWLKYLFKTRQDTPSATQALLCFTLMLVLAWFAMQAIGTSIDPLVGMGIGHLIFIFAPPVVMSFLLTRSPVTTLRLVKPDARYLWIAIGLAFALNPLVREFGHFVDQIFPPPKLVLEQVSKMIAIIPKNPLLGLLVFALIPAITEEIAFRGFILSGLERNYKTWTAILFSAFLFGYLHVLLSLFSQLFPGILHGIVLGWLAVRSRSLFPGIAYHLINNGMGVILVAIGASLSSLGWLFRDTEQGLFQWPVVILGSSIAAVLLWLLAKVKPATTSVVQA